MTTTSGGLGEAEVGGPTLSIVPKSGGNTLAGNIYASGTGGGLVGSNYSSVIPMNANNGLAFIPLR